MTENVLDNKMISLLCQMEKNMKKQTDWWKGAVIYQIYPRSFKDSNGDGIGDLNGITQKLDYVAALGVDAIWLSPIFTSPMKDMGYDVSDYCDIDPLFGTLADFDKLLARAHELGLKVMIDQVISHSSDQHPFFEESRQSKDNPKSDWYVWADAKPDGTPPNNWISIFGGSAWQWDTRRKQYYLHNFLTSQPDFNFHNHAVQEYMLGTVRFWLERGVDGFRLDTVNFYFHDKSLADNPVYENMKPFQTFNPYNYQNPIHSKNRPDNLRFLEKLRGLLDEYEGRTMVGEVGEHVQPLELMAEYTQNQRLHMAYSFEMLGFEFSPKHFESQISGFFNMAPKGWPCWAMSNHDVVRQVSRYLPHGVNQDQIAKFAAALLLSFEGSICLYQGEELGQTETELEFHELTDPQGIEFWPADKGRDGCRTPMVWDSQDEFAGFSTHKPWLPIKKPQHERAVSSQEAENSVLNFYRDMLHLRRNNEGLRSGQSNFLIVSKTLLAFTRDNKFLCVFNFGDNVERFEWDKSYEIRLSQNTESDQAGLTLEKNGFVIAKIM